jgi:CheY-like chemotaxis protein
MNDKQENNKSPKLKLLYVEDDIVAVDIMTKLLEGKYEIDSVGNGQDALKMAKEKAYDAFLIDIGLPGSLDGIQTTKELKKIKNNDKKPYIAITAYAMPSEVKSFLSGGLTHYISKPFEFKNVFEVIEKALEKSKIIA